MSKEKVVTLRILSVEDCQADFDVVVEMLTSLSNFPSFKIDRAKTLAEGRRKLETAKTAYNVLLVDLNLPDSEGEETFLEIRTCVHDAIIIVLTGIEDNELGIRLLKRGAQDFIPKSSLSRELLGRSILYARGRQHADQRSRRLSRELKATNEKLSAAELALIRAEKLESLGRMAAGIAHEVKNPLSVLQAIYDYFRTQFEPGNDRAQARLNLMRNAIQRANKTISGMLDFARESALELEQCNINEVVKQSIEKVQFEFHLAQTQLELDFEEGLPPVSIDVLKIEEVLINIMTNAVQAMGHSGTLHISTSVDQGTKILRESGVGKKPRPELRADVITIDIRDTG
ncbi:MAG: response regulator, partial [Verrucomicrobiota bacterium]